MGVRRNLYITELFQPYHRVRQTHNLASSLFLKELRVTQQDGKESFITVTLHKEQTNKVSSSVFDSVLLASSNDGGTGSDFGYYRAELIMFGFHALTASRGLPAPVSVI